MNPAGDIHSADTDSRDPRPTHHTYGEWVHLLDEDPDLGEGLDSTMFARANRLLHAPVATVPCRRPRLPEPDPRTSFGLLVLDGLIGRRLGVGPAHATELLGPGDILRPWDRAELVQSVPPEISWRVFQRLRLAILDEEITKVIGRRPELVIAFSGRLLRRGRCSDYLRAAGNLRHVDEKVLLMLWHLASRWGHVTTSGTAVPFALTHELIGEIIGARRPTVTVALNHMRRDGLLRRGNDGRLLLCASPEDWSLMHRERSGVAVRDLPTES